ncbi:MAG: 4a-hydroxytetrahydrobiopterin dehydratase [Sulfuricella sp.]|nr:4a-hydroxytetrahydrobiopterin dehydratase [Sulfuricella sp.]
MSGIVALSGNEIAQRLGQLSGWEFAGGAIIKVYRFQNYYQTMAFVNATAWVSHREDHHPDLEVGYNQCLIRYRTHDIDGLSENDFICAAKIDALLDI